MHWWDPRMGWPMMLCGGVLGLLILAALVVIAVLLFRRTSAERGEARSRQMPASQTPMEILKERYARGEITREEYQEMREHLRD
jgi:putative membrane protein